MTPARADTAPVWAGDSEGLGVVYDSGGNLLLRPDEDLIEVAPGWEMEVRSPWRRLLPKMLFEGFRGVADSRLFVTSRRIVLLRQIDTWRQVSGEMTLLGTPNAIAKEARLSELKRLGIRQFCIIRPASCRLNSMKKFQKHGSMIDMRLTGIDGHEYAVTIWKTGGRDDRTLSLLESRFRG